MSWSDKPPCRSRWKENTRLNVWHRTAQMLNPARVWVESLNSFNTGDLIALYFNDRDGITQIFQLMYGIVQPVQSFIELLNLQCTEFKYFNLSSYDV